MIKLQQKRRRRVGEQCFLTSIFVFLLTAFHAQGAELSLSTKRNDGYKLLALVGYNYTDRDISSYSVDGAGGGHINLSSPKSGGSGLTCCVRLSKQNAGPIQVTVRWQVDGCTYLMRNESTGEADRVRYYYYKETEVNVERIGNDFSYIETHFYPDGKVQVRLTEYPSRPILALDENRAEKSHFPKCKDDKNPED